MSGRIRYRNAVTHTDKRTEKVQNFIPGILGFTIKGKDVVEVDPRPGHVYVRIRDNFSEVVIAFNSVVAPVYGLPVLLIRDDKDKNRYQIYGRDTARYANWGTTSAYLPKHGDTHSFDPYTPGGDPVWVWGRQLMPLAAVPSGSLGAPNVIIEEGVYWKNGDWNFAGATGTANITPYNPTGSSARMVLVYIDENTCPKLLAGTTFFATNITGTSQVLPYIPDVPGTATTPVAGIRLVSGTSVILWDNIYDLRGWLIGMGVTGSVGTPGTPGASGPPGSNTLLIYDDSVFKVTGTAISFDDGLIVSVTGSIAYVKNTGTTGGSLPEFSANVVPFADDAGDLTHNDLFTAELYDSTYPVVNVGGAKSFFAASNSNYYNINSVSDYDGSQISLGMWGFGVSPVARFLQANGTVGSPTITAKNDVIGSIDFYGYAGGIYSHWVGSQIVCTSEVDWDDSPTVWATSLGFWTSETGTSHLHESLKLYTSKANFYGSVQIPSGTSGAPAPSFYFGEEYQDGSWRITRSGNDLVIQRRESSSWVTKQTIAAA